MNPSRYRLPQKCSPDRRRARRATLALQRREYVLQEDAGPGHPAPGFRLPPGAALLPAGESFGPEKMFRLLKHKAAVKLQAPIVKWRLRRRRMDEVRDYVQALGWIRRPRSTSLWRSDGEFARQRLTGCNPMSIRRCNGEPEKPLVEAAARVLEECHHARLGSALSAGRLFQTEYGALRDARIQRQVPADASLATPTCLFYADDRRDLVPIAIQLAPAESADHAVLTPFDRHWLLARAHAQAADAHYHEAIFHLLETHMVSEVFALCTARHLHPDHPLCQLLRPHFEGNLAINYLARHDLLAPGGAIDATMAAGVGGALDAARRWWSSWSFADRRLEIDLAERGVDDPKALPGYLYRDDARLIRHVIEDFATEILRIWYRGAADVVEDDELQDWADALAAIVPGFPSRQAQSRPRIRSVAELIQIATDVIFRASAQHAAVNIGQFEAYGFVPNAPGTVFAALPRGGAAGPADPEDGSVLRAMPPLATCLTQIGMAWVLSEPTHRSLLTSGESPAFDAALCPEAAAAVNTFRSRLRDLSQSIRVRNRQLAVPYTALDPHNVARSTAI